MVRRSPTEAVGEVGVPRQAAQEPCEGCGETELGRAAVGRLAEVAVPGVARPWQQVAERDEDGNDDRGRPASGLGFEDDRDRADHEPGLPRERDERDPGEAASNAAPPAPYAVSYTPLDVSKRQQIASW